MENANSGLAIVGNNKVTSNDGLYYTRTDSEGDTFESSLGH